MLKSSQRGDFFAAKIRCYSTTATSINKLPVEAPHEEICDWPAVFRKTSVATYLRERAPGSNVVEMDEEIRGLCDGAWPEDDNYKESELVPRVLGRVSLVDNVIFFENHMSVERTRQLKHAGFIVIMIQVGRAELLRRDTQRVAEEGYNSIVPYLDGQLSNMDELVAHGLVDYVVDGERTTTQVAELVLAYGNNVP